MHFGLQGGFLSPAVIINGTGNSFFGGVTGGFSFGAGSSGNRVVFTKILGTGRGITDLGSGNSYEAPFNITDAVPLPTKAVRARTNFVLDATATVTVDASRTAYAVVAWVGASAGTITLDKPIRAADANDLEVTIRMVGAGALTLALASGSGGFKAPALTLPAVGFARTYRFRHDPNWTSWLFTGDSGDVPL
jgi:hypothetical protein